MQSYRKLKPATNLCDGVRPAHRIPCNGTLYRCTACGKTGCRQTQPDRCTHQAFNVLFGCLECGAVGKQEPVPEGAAA
jgi:hypothetical protein